MDKNKKYSKYFYVDVPEYKTCRELIECGHVNGGDSKQFVFLENRNTVREKTFNEVWYDTVGLGQYLYKKGLLGKKVAILSDNSYYWIICFYSLMTGKYITVPLDPKLTDPELIDIMKRSRCEALYYSDDFAGTVEKMKQADGVCVTEYIKIHDFDALVAEGHADLDAGGASYLDFPPQPDELATIVFSSGTTGRSKGVMLSHRNIASNCIASGRCIQGTNAIGFLPMNHLFAWASALFLTNVFGAWGYICRSLKDIPHDMKKYHPQNMAGVPLLVETIYKTIWREAEKKGKAKALRAGIKISNFLRKFGIDIRRKLFKEIIDEMGGKLEYIVCGGAYLDQKYEKCLTDIGIDILGAYGTSECAPGVTLNTQVNHRFGSCGKPLSCCEVRIKDPDENGVGEILVKGSNVMMGYYEDPEATASVFEGDWFMTGDYGYFDKDGYLYFVGRKKNLIVLANGKNVSPEELEDQLNKIEYVKEVIVYGENDLITAEFYLDGSLCPNAEEQIQKDVDEFNKNLPVFKRIRQVKTRDSEFPKTTTMKIKREYKD